MLVLAILSFVINSVYLIIVSAGWVNDREGMSFPRYLSFSLPYVISIIFGVWFLATHLTIAEAQ